MKLKELKCKNCGAKLKVDENVDVVTCKYCNTTFSVEDTYKESYKKTKGMIDATNDAYKEKLKEQRKNPIYMFVSIFIVIVFIVVFFSIGYGIYKSAKNTNEFNKQFEVNKFNIKFSNYNGTKNKFWIDDYLDDIVTNNKTNTSHLITVVYKDISTTDPKEITNIKKQIKDNKDYEVIVDYDNNGYFNKMTIEE